MLALHVVIFAVACDSSSIELRMYSPQDPAAPVDRWPKVLKVTYSQAVDSGVPTESLKVIEVFYDEFYFEFRSSPEQERFWIESLRIREVKREEPFVQKFLKRIPPLYKQSAGLFFSNSNRIDGEKGDQIILMKDGSSDLYIGHYYFNF